jgi:hypothetical protein
VLSVASGVSEVSWSPMLDVLRRAVLVGLFVVSRRRILVASDLLPGCYQLSL